MKKLHLVLAAIFMLTSQWTVAQLQISGKVVDSQQQPLIGAHIAIQNTFLGAITDNKGEFVISGLRQGTYEVKVSFLGYMPQTQTVNLQNEQSLSFELQNNELLTDEVIVAATRAGTKVPIAYDLVERDEIEQRNTAQDIPYLLSMTPSLVESSDAGTGIGYSSLRIRGTDITRINITVNGIPMNDSESHGVWWVNMPDLAASVDNIQVQRGVGTSTNGAGAFGASINFKTKSTEKKPHASLNASYGSFNTRKISAQSGTGLLNNHFTFDMRLSDIHSDGYIDRARSDMQSYFTSLGYHGKKSLLTINFFGGQEETYQAWWGVPKARLNSDASDMQRYLDHWLYTPDEYQNMIDSDPRTYNYYTYENEIDHYEQTHLQAIYAIEPIRNLTLNAAFHYTRGLGYYEQYKPDQALADYGLADIKVGTETVTQSDLIRQKWLDNHFYGFTYSANYKRKNLDLTIGGAWNRYDGGHYGEIVRGQFLPNVTQNYRWYDNNGTKTDFNTFAKLSYRLTQRINAFVDLQYRGIEYDITGIHDDFRDISQSHHFPFLNPKLGLLSTLSNNLKTYLSVARANREPSRSEYRDSDENNKPLPEQLTDFEWGASYNSQSWAVESNIYAMLYKNQLVMTGQINDVGSPINTNVPESYRAGIELTTKIRPMKQLELEANATVSRNRITNYTGFIDDWDTGEQRPIQLDESHLTFSPEIIANGHITYRPFESLMFDWKIKHVGKQYIDNSSSTDAMLDAYTVQDATISYKIPSRNLKNLAIQFQIINALDVKYETFAWVYRYYYGDRAYTMDGYFPQAGRHYMLSFSIKI